MPSTDLLGGIDTILGKAKSNSYSSQFEMDLEVNRLIKSAHDGHLSFQLCSQSIFTYQVDMPLVSISTDGLALPQVYMLGLLPWTSILDTELTLPDDAKLQKSDPKAVSPLVSINGTDVAEYLESYANGQNLQDRDAQYVFTEIEQSAPY
jgi:hypothetical protein